MFAHTIHTTLSLNTHEYVVLSGMGKGVCVCVCVCVWGGGGGGEGELDLLTQLHMGKGFGPM